MNLSTIQKRLFAWGMGKANDADADRIKLIDCPEYQSLGELKQALLGNLQHQSFRNWSWCGSKSCLLPRRYSLDWYRTQSLYAPIFRTRSTATRTD